MTLFAADPSGFCHSVLPWGWEFRVQEFRVQDTLQHLSKVN